MHPNRSNRRVHSAEFKTQVLAECRQPGASISAVAISHGLNPNVVRKWLAGHGLKRMGAAAAGAAPESAVRGMAPAMQFVPVELARPAPVLAAPTSQPDLRIEFQRGGLQVKLQCPPGAGALYAAQLRALADALCAA
jgi:transposase